MVLDLNINLIKREIILNSLITIHEPDNLFPDSLLTPIIWNMLLNKAAGADQLFIIAFSTLYLIRKADFNKLQICKVSLKEYIHHLLYFINR
jgi:hypothetical protein